MKPETRNPLKSAARLGLFAGLAVVALGLAYLLFTPRVYQAAARVRIENKGLTLDGPLRPAQVSEAPLMVREQLVLQSAPLLGQVITNLDLVKAWSARPSASSSLATDEVLGTLQRMVRVEIIPRTSVIEVRVASGHQEEPARIANEIVRLYQAGHESKRQNFTEDGMLDIQRQWETGNQQLQAARDRLVSVVADLRRVRATNDNAYLLPGDLQQLRARRIDVETGLTAQESTLARLRALTPEQLRQVLPMTVTNGLLNGLESRLLEARLNLVEVSGSHASDSPEVKGAAAAVRELDGHVTEVVQGLMTSLADDAASKKRLLAKMDGELSHAGTAAPDFSTNNPAYAAAFQEVRSLEQQRELLEGKLNTNSLEALYPLYPATEIVDTADPPVRPSSPDFRLACGILATGGLLVAVGLMLLALAGRRRPLQGALQKPAALR